MGERSLSEPAYVLACMLCGISFERWAEGERIPAEAMANGESCPCGEDPHEIMWFRRIAVHFGPPLLGPLPEIEKAKAPEGLRTAWEIRHGR
jgi:hypothetical protein